MLLSIENDSTFLKYNIGKLWCYEILEDFYRRNNNEAAADKYLLKYYKASNELENDGHLETFDEFQLKSDLEDYREHIRAAEAEQHRRSIIGIIALIIAISLISILTILLVNSRKRRRYINLLYQRALDRIPEQPEESDDSDTVEIKDNKSAAEALPKGEDSNDKDDFDDSELFDKINRILEESDLVFNPDFGMNQLCMEVGSNITYVSRAINSHYGVNFKTKLTQRRIREACRLFSLPDSDKYSIEGMAHHVGFKSRVTFANAFKSTTGLTPGEFRKAARHDKANL